jgi:Protein of unknown function (DUF3060)
MEPQEDPEARIRELERGIADVARASELGVAQHGSRSTYLPPPVPEYGAPPPFPMAGPYLGAPQKTKSGSGGMWLVFAGIAVVLLLFAGGVVIFATSMFKLDSNTRPPVDIPGVSGGGGQVDAPRGQPSIPAGVPTPPPGTHLSVSGIDKNQTIACNESIVTVSGFNNTVTITGHCVSLTVSGQDNVVTVDTTDTISASGFDNQVVYRSGSPEIIATDSNVVSHG